MMMQLISLLSFNEISTTTITIILFVLLTLLYFAGFKLKRWFIKRGTVEENSGLGIVEGALLSLFGLFIGFTFSMASYRFDHRRETIIAEANNIGTAILRTDLYPDSARTEIRSHLKLYLEYRIAYYDAVVDESLIKASLEGANKESGIIWNIITSLGKNPENREATLLMVPALNEMIDIVTTRESAKNGRVPTSVLWVLIVLSLCSSFIAGYGTRGKSINYVVSLFFIVMITSSIYLIIDLDRPRRGLINTDDANNKIIELREMFK